MLNNKSILITGGTGSFGKKFIQIALERYPNINKIIVFSRDEFKQFEMQNQPEFKIHQGKLRYFLGDVRDKERLHRAFQGIDLIIHGAALKQVPACEYNPFEAVKTNILGAQNIIDCAIDCNVEKVVALSTDKACSPLNLYGATKLCSDKLFVAGNAYSGIGKTRFSVVRYGNVAGSRGSVIPFFQKLMREKADFFPITDMNMTRFWLKLDQAVEMVLEAIDHMHGGELYVKKIPSMKLPELAKALDPNMPLKEVGIRPGEKIHEQMITKEDAHTTIDIGGFYIILPQTQMDRLSVKYKNAKHVKPDFEYHSGNNTDWLSVDDMKELIASIEDKL